MAEGTCLQRSPEGKAVLTLPTNAVFTLSIVACMNIPVQESTHAHYLIFVPG